MTARPVNSQVKHGSPTCADYGCKREECLEARRRKQKRNKFLKESGRPGMVPADRAAAHLVKFRQAGLQDAEIISRVGVARNTFYRAMRGEPLTRQSEQKILAVPAPRPSGQVRTLANVDATGTRRRLQALMWLGWPSPVLENRLGVHERWISRAFRERNRVTLAVEARIRDLYDECWQVQPEQAGIPAEDVEAARRYALRMGWEGPLAWDDDTIGDPSAVPQTDASAPVPAEGQNVAGRWLLGESVVLGPEHRKEVIQHFFEWTQLTKEEIGERLEMTPAAVEQIWVRLKKKARLAGLPEPKRRVFGMRDKELEKKDMEAAA